MQIDILKASTDIEFKFDSFPAEDVQVQTNPVHNENENTPESCWDYPLVKTLLDVGHQVLMSGAPGNLINGTNDIWVGCVDLKSSLIHTAVFIGSSLLTTPLLIIAAVAWAILAVTEVSATAITIAVAIPLVIAAPGLIVGTISFIAGSILICRGVYNIISGATQVHDGAKPLIGCFC